MIPWHGASGTSSSEFRTPPKKRVLKVNKKPAVNASTVPRPAFRFRSAVTQDWFASENSPSDWEVVKRPGVWRGTQKWASYDFTHANGVFFWSSWGFFIVGYDLTATVINMIFPDFRGMVRNLQGFTNPWIHGYPMWRIPPWPNMVVS